MILSLEQKKVDEANTVLRSLLVGSQLDRFTVFGMELNLCFFHPPIPQVWLSTTQEVSLALPSKKPAKCPDIQTNRRELLPDLYSLIGEDISHVSVAVTGALEIQFADGARLQISDFDEDEILWSVTSDSPAPFVHHDWAVTLSDWGELSVKSPEASGTSQS